MNPTKDTIRMQLLGKTYTMACPPEETSRLKAAAQYVDEKVRALASSHPGIALEQMAVMVALELSHELLTHRHELLDYRESLETKMKALTAVLDSELHTS
jgi:cell division protein ZapA